MQRVRFALMLVLVLVPVGIGVLASDLVKARILRTLVAGSPSILDQHIAPAPAREANVTVMLRSTVRGVEVSGDYVIEVQPYDELVDLVRTGRVDGRELAELAGGPREWTYTPPVVEYSGTRSPARLLVSSSPRPVLAGTYVDHQYGVPGEVQHRMLRVRAEGVPIAELYGDPPVTQRRDYAEFTGRVIGFVFIRVTPGGTLGWNGWSLTNGPALWHIAMALPWLLVLVLSRRSRHPARAPMRTAAAVYLVSVPMLAALLLWVPATVNVALALVFVVAPALTVVWCRRVRGETAFDGRMPWLCAGIALVSTATACAVALSGPAAAWPLVLGGVLAGGFVAAGVLVVRRRDWLPAAFLGIALVPGTLVVEFLVQQLRYDWAGVAGVALGLFLTPVLFGVARLVGVRRRWLMYPLLVLASAVLLLPAAAVLDDVVAALQESYPITHPLALGEPGVVVLITVLLVVLGVLLHHMSDGIDVYRDPLPRAAVIATVVAFAIPARITWLGPVVTVLCMVVTVQWLVPAGRVDSAARLARISKRAHAWLVREEIWHRLTNRIAQEVYRTGHSRAASGDVELSELRKIWSATVGTGTLRTGLSLTEAALGSGGGHAARRNLLAGVGAAAVLALPIMWYEASITFFNSGTELNALSTLNLLDDGRQILRWVAYGALFGLFYPAIRGTRPVAKAGFLLIALLIPELLAIVTAPYSTTQAVWFASGIRTGQVTVLCIGLGLFWEWRLSRAANLRWGQLRDFRSASALVTPVTTVVVAAATAIATALAGAAVSAVLKEPPNQPPAPDSRPASVQQK